MRRPPATARITSGSAHRARTYCRRATAVRRLASGTRIWRAGLPSNGSISVPRSIRILQVVTGALVLVYLASTILRTPGTPSIFYDVWVANLGYAGCTVLCAWRAIARRRGRWGWGALAGGLLLFTAGSVLWTGWIQYFNPVPYPSIADFCFLALFFMAFLG